MWGHQLGCANEGFLPVFSHPPRMAPIDYDKCVDNFAVLQQICLTQPNTRRSAHDRAARAQYMNVPD